MIAIAKAYQMQPTIQTENERNQMSERLDVDICQKIIDLRRVYGTTGVSDLLNIVELASIKLSDIPDTDFTPAMAKKIRSNIRLYWKSWMNSKKEESNEDNSV